jgi:hypothetical protein
MRLVKSHGDFRVYDDVLPAARFRQVWRYVQAQEFEFVQRERWFKVWRLDDGEPLWGPEILTAGAAASVAARRRDGSEHPQDLIFPTGRAIDHVIAAVQRISRTCAPLIGTSPRDWSGLTAQSYLYPPGSGLSWHKDSSDRTGAFIYYAHPYWNVTFGGELLIAERGDNRSRATDRRRRRQPRPVGPHLDNQAENRALLARGVGSFVHAKPNRLVILRGGTPHMIKAVTAAAGNNVRCSISGFFVRPQ